MRVNVTFFILQMVKNHESFDEFSIANWQLIECVLGNDWKAENNLLRMLSHENLNEFWIGILSDFLFSTTEPETRLSNVLSVQSQLISIYNNNKLSITDHGWIWCFFNHWLRKGCDFLIYFQCKHCCQFYSNKCANRQNYKGA